MRPASLFRALIPIAALALAACGRHDTPAASASGAPPPLAVTAIRATAQRVPISIEAVGQAEGSRDIEIRARVTGIVEKRLYDEGTPVAAGKVLFVIDPVPYELAVEQARAALMQERSRRELAEVEARRLEPLAADRAISQRELDQAKAAASQAVAAVASAEAKLKEAELNLGYTRISAPISGISGRALRSEGSLATANTDSALLTTITQVNPIWVRFPLAETDYNRLRGAQQNARVQMVGEDGTVLADNGRLNFTGTTVDPKMGAVQLRAEFANPGTRWLPGQFARVRVLAGEQNAMRVPQSAVLQTDQSKVVMTVGPDNKVAPKAVTTANWIGSDMIVTGGLAEGDLVIVDNLVKLRPGAQVAPHAPGEAPKGAPGVPAKTASAK
jgi:membrane fusion protein (multidrug efflux system)